VRLAKIFKRSFSFLLTLAGVFFLLVVFVSIGSLNFIGAFFGAALSSLSLYFSQRLRARSADLVLANDHRPPLIYLRSFGADQGYQGGAWFRMGRAESDEEALSRLLQQIGPLVAIGKPGEFLPLLGASRMYVDHENWQGVVSDLLSKAALLILRVGATDGLLWEVSAARSAVLPSKLLIWHPHYGRRAKKRRFRDAVYQVFRSKVEQQFPVPLPEAFPRNSEFLFFADDWTPHFASGRPSLYARLRGFTSLSRLPKLRAELRNALLNANLTIPRIPWRPIEFLNAYLFLMPLFFIAIFVAAVVGDVQPLHRIPAEFNRALASRDAWSPDENIRIGQGDFLRTEMNLRLFDGTVTQSIMMCDLSAAAVTMRIGLYLPDDKPFDLAAPIPSQPPGFKLVIDGTQRDEVSESAGDRTVFGNAVAMTLPFRKASKVVAHVGEQSSRSIGARLSAFVSEMKAELYMALLDRARRLSNAKSVNVELTAENRRHYTIDLRPQDTNFQTLIQKCRERVAQRAR
jgi:hypothetical protein